MSGEGSREVRFRGGLVQARCKVGGSRWSGACQVRKVPEVSVWSGAKVPEPGWSGAGQVQGSRSADRLRGGPGL